MIKKITLRSIASLIGVTMLCACVVVSAAAASSKPDSDYEKKVMVLAQLDLIYEPDTYLTRPNEGIARADMAYAGGNLISQSPGGETKITDVSNAHWAYAQIQQVVSGGIMGPVAGEAFAPSEKITNSQTAEALARVIWNEALFSMNGDDSQYVLSRTAKEIRTSADQTAGTTRRQFVTMLEDVIGKKTMELMSFGSQDGDRTVQVQENKDETLLSKYRQIEKVSDVVTANARTALLSPNGAGEGKVQIGENQYNAGETDIADFLGYRVTAYVKTDENGYKTVCAFYEDRNRVVKIADQNIKSTSRYEISYYNDNNKIKTEKLTKFTDIIYNGVMTSEITGEDFHVQEGFLTLIDNDSNGAYDVIAVEAYENILVKSADWNNHKIYDELTGAVLDVNEETADVSYFLSELSVTREEAEKYIAADDTLTVLRSINTTGKKSMIIYICFDKDVGILTGKNNDGDRIRIGEKEYQLSDAAKKAGYAAKFDVGETVQVYFNHAGKIMYIKASSESGSSGKQYGYLLNISQSTGFGDGALFLVFDEKGQTRTLEAPGKIRFNAQRVPAKDAVTAMKEKGFQSQLIQFVARENILTELTTAQIGKNEDEFSLDCVLLEASFNENIRSYLFDSKNIDPRFEKDYNAAYGVEFSTGTSARALMVGGRDENGIISDEDILWLDGASLVENTKWDEVSFYDVDKAHVASVTVIEAKAAKTAVDFRGANFKWFLVSDVVRALEENETVIKVEGWQNSNQVSYSLTRILVEETDGTDPAAAVQVNEYDAERYQEFIQPGDILQVKVDVKNEIQSFRRIFTHQEKDPDHFDKNTIYKNEGFSMSDRQSGNYNTNSGSLHIYGRVIAKTHDSKVLIQSNIQGVDVYRSRGLVERNDVSFYKMRKNKSGYSIEKAKPADVMGDELTGSKVVVQSRVTGLLDIVILDED